LGGTKRNELFSPCWINAIVIRSITRSRIRIIIEMEIDCSSPHGSRIWTTQRF